MLHAYDATLVPKPLRVQFDEIFAELGNRVKKTGDEMSGYLGIRSGDWSGLNLYNLADKYFRIETNPDNALHFGSFIYRNVAGENEAVIYIPKRNGEIALKGDVAVLTGEIGHGGWLPIPAGFAEHECRFFVSVNNSNPNLGTWDWNESRNGMHYRTICELKGRVVTCQTIVNEGISGHGATHTIIEAKANYLVVGVKQ